MPAGTSSIRRVNVRQDKAPGVTPPSRAISPPGNREVIPTVTRAPRKPPHDGRTYNKNPAGGGFNLPGFGPSEDIP